MPDEQVQSIYDELNRRGVFSGNEQAAAIGHELRRRGVVSDPTQGGAVSVSSGGATGMDPDFNSKLQQMVQASGGKLSITDGFRTRAQQEDLFRRKPNLAAQPGHSLHEKGLAADLDGDLEWAHANAERFGLVFPMLDPKGKKYEPWHVQPANYANRAETPATPPGAAQAVGAVAGDIAGTYGRQISDAYKIDQAESDAKLKPIDYAREVLRRKNPDMNPVQLNHEAHMMVQRIRDQQGLANDLGVPAQRTPEGISEQVRLANEETLQAPVWGPGTEHIPPIFKDRSGQIVVHTPSQGITELIAGPGSARALSEMTGKDDPAMLYGALPTAAKFILSMADPQQQSILMGAGAVGMESKLAAKTLSALFATDMAKSAVNDIREGNYGSAAVNALFARLAQKHASGLIDSATESLIRQKFGVDISKPISVPVAEPKTLDIGTARRDTLGAGAIKPPQVETVKPKMYPVEVPHYPYADKAIIQELKSRGVEVPAPQPVAPPELEQGTAVPERPQFNATGAAQTTPPAITPESVSVSGAEAVPQPESAKTSADSGPPPIERQSPLTGAANRVTDAERTARGLEPVTKQEYTLVKDAYEQGRQAVDSGSVDARSVAQEVAARPRPLNAQEVGALAYDRAQIINAHSVAVKAADAAVEAGDARVAQTERARIGNLEDLLDLNDQALQKGGREQSAAFAARKMLVAEDYSYAGMIQRAKVAKGSALNEAQRTKVQALEATIKGMDEAIQSHLGRIAELESQSTIRKAAREDAMAVRSSVRRITRQSLDAEYEQLKQAFTKAGSKLNAGFDPETASLVGKMAVNRLRATKITVSEVVDHLFNDLKDHIPNLRREDIRDAFRQAQAEPLEAQKTRTTQSATEYRRRLEAGEVAPPQRKTTLPYDRELEQLKMDQESAKRAYQRMVQDLGKSKGQKLARTTGEVLDAGRSVITSVDLSAPGRQGWFLVASHPFTAARSFIPMLRAAVSEHGARAVDIEIHSRPNAPNYADSGLYLSPVEHTGKLSALEEAYRSNLAEQLPGIGPLVRGSERAYVTFLNKLRADNFDLLHSQVERSRFKEADMAGADRAIANFINKATGRGSLGEVGNHASTLLNRIFFSPRFVASRFQILAGEPLWGGTAASRAVIARTYLQYIGAVGSIIYLSKLAGAKVDLNYHSPDFLKLRFGKQAVVDVHAGFQQTARFLANMYSGDVNRGETAARFARGKTSPLAGTAIDVLTGKDFIGNKVNTPKEAMQHMRRGTVKPNDYMESEPARNLVPMSVKDISEAAQKENVPTTVALSMLALLGVGVAEYPKKSLYTHRKPAYSK